MQLVIGDFLAFPFYEPAAPSPFGTYSGPGSPEARCRGGSNGVRGQEGKGPLVRSCLHSLLPQTKFLSVGQSICGGNLVTVCRFYVTCFFLCHMLI